LAIRRKRNDDFGELIRPEDFLRAEERDEIDGQDLRQPNKYDTRDTLGKKRKWNDVAAPGDRRLSNSNKRQMMDKRGQRDDSMDLADYLPGGEVDDGFEEDVEEEIIKPSRLVFSTDKVSIDLRLAFVDFAGLHDKRSLQMLIPLIQPRKLILVSGMKDETLALANDCRKLLATQFSVSDDDVYTPEVGVVVDASVDTNAWVVKLTDALVKRLRWQNVRGLSIVTLTGQLESPQHAVEADDERTVKKQRLLTPSEENTLTQESVDAAPALVEMPILDVLPSTLAAATRSVAQPLHVGDLRLADLRKIMQSSNHTAEFRGEGTLLIDGSVIVRKTGTGRIEVESIGAERNTFYAVKSKIYQGLAVVAGG
jgi:cleavage and polyadenylation specificity factor subunit 2